MNYSRLNLKWNGWGWRHHHHNFQNHEDEFWDALQEALGGYDFPHTPSIKMEEIQIAPPQITKIQLRPLRLLLGEQRVKVDRFERIFHAKGRGYCDLIKIRRGEISPIPDAVIYPKTSEEIRNILDFAQEHHLAVIPFGGGSNVMGGIEPHVQKDQKGSITLDMSLMNQMISLDKISQTATFQAGIYGPLLEKTLKSHHYTLGHFPQSFEFSTLGGWVATRSVSQQSSNYSGLKDWLVATKVITPSGKLQTSPFPAASSGPNLNHLITGSEGSLGVITEATVKIKTHPALGDHQAILFPNFEVGLSAMRQMVQQKIPLTVLRLSDEEETEFMFQLKRKRSLANWIQPLIHQFFRWKRYKKAPVLLLLECRGSPWEKIGRAHV